MKYSAVISPMSWSKLSPRLHPLGLSGQRRKLEQLTNRIALRSMLLFQKVPEASGGKVGRAFGGLGGVNLGVGEVGQPFAIGCHPACTEKAGGYTFTDGKTAKFEKFRHTCRI